MNQIHLGAKASDPATLEVTAPLPPLQLQRRLRDFRERVVKMAIVVYFPSLWVPFRLCLCLSSVRLRSSCFRKSPTGSVGRRRSQYNGLGEVRKLVVFGTGRRTSGLRTKRVPYRRLHFFCHRGAGEAMRRCPASRLGDFKVHLYVVIGFLLN